ncbi:S9 family peptidase [Anaeromyxobacter terrae]|uniref:S9 family peptidase n=1 Tax=Anaeromyxobacter terrae TaxID=2925406 RepID=UPI001F55B94D|nr:S9 family peptidase [Anaeromyxobacter sp. SG22]
MPIALLAALALAAGPSPLALTPMPGQPNLLALGVPEIPASLAVRLDQYQNARGATLLDVAPDGGTLLVGTRFGSTVQLHVVSHPLGMREQVTFGKEPVLDARLVPGDPRTILYLQDVGGGEFYQLYRLDRRTGRSELLTDGKSRHEALLVSHDGRRLAYAGTGRNGKDTDVYVADLARPREARRIVEGEGSFLPLDLSPDGARLLVSRFRSIADADLRVVEIATGASRPLLEGEGSLRDAAFSADGRSVYAVTDRFGDRNALYRIDLDRAGATPRPVAPGVAAEVEQVAVARDGRVAFTVNADGYSLLHLLDPRAGRLSAAPLPPGVAGRLAFPAGRGDRLAVSVSSATSPSDVHVLDLRTRALTRWTRSEVGGIDPSLFVEPELVRYPSTDGVEVPAFLYRPRGEGRRPVVVLWHGGPEGQSRPAFSPFVQFLAAELGVAVLAPNVRGSDGYGKRYLAADDGVRREQALADIGATFDFIARRPDLDASRVAVYGGSYGGYMVLASMTFFPERVRAGVDVVGISSLPTFLQSTQAYRRDLRRAEYGDERLPEVRAVQERISPLNHVARIRAPLFVVQGKNDPRVPRSEAEQIVEAVRANGKEVWYLLAEDEGHGFQKKENRDTMTSAVALFLERMLAAGGASPPEAAGTR